ncbi:dehydrogenase/reductase SDR family member 12 isoform X8 [Sorex araneus]|uniref:dehydrogenase/reductase SDR family member 12 isoform X8 n=1 Tax=Sorex araneus TaxID=42254 RepID=UPI002433CB84|nr:dehydrogenase/reductase SDR family member 12 isoform X8 [Sorex araneus]
MVPCIPLGVIPEHRAMSEPRAQPGVAPKQNTSATKHALRIAFIQHGAFGQVEKNTFSKHPLPPVRSGYEAAAQHFSPEDLDVQVSGRAFLVTGANSGLGKATALEIAKRGGTVHLVCRDAARSEAAQTEILRESGNQNIFLHIVDLSDPKEIWKFVENFKQEHTLNVLINNAGCMVNKREITEDGLEKNFATNTLGIYILTVALIPVLEKAQDPRVVTVSSGGMLVQKLSTLDLQWERAAFDGTMVYAQNKRQQVVMTEQWARVHPTIHFSAMHPGWADTPGVRQAMPGFHARFKDRLRTAAQGADTVLWLALAAAASKQPSGLFFQDRKPVPKHLPLARTSSSPAEEERLMEILDEMAQRFR